VRPLIVVFGVRFERQTEAADRWWKENHETSNAIGDEIRWVADHLQTSPYMWPAAENARKPGLRRVFLQRIGYHLYYRVDERRGRITFTDFRHARRRPIRI
jgi:hypothetical protein